MNRRQEKGYDLAATVGALARDGIYWRVASQSRASREASFYVVDVSGETPTCTCPDYELSGLKCKHIYAVQYRQQIDAANRADGCACACDRPTVATSHAKPTKTPQTPRPTYRQDWPAYNAAQTHEKAHFQALLHALCVGIEEPAYTFGRPRLPLREMIFAAAFKVYSTVSARRFMSDLADAQAKGYLRHLPNAATVLRVFEDASVTPILRALIEVSSLPLAAIETQFAVDSTGFTTCRYVRWYDAKYGDEMERHDWLKCHFMCGVISNIVTAVEVTGAYGADYPQFAPLVKATARNFHLYEVSADKAYSGRPNLQLVDDLHATPYIPFKSNSTGAWRSEDLWDRLYWFYQLHRETFLAHYHRRSLVESTVWMIKAKFGDALRSKTDTAQVNELLCKVLCHNICVLIQSMYEVGLPVEFWQSPD